MGRAASRRSRADEPGAVSRLSPYLRFGQLSARQLYHAVKHAGYARETTKTFARRLHWRCALGRQHASNSFVAHSVRGGCGCCACLFSPGLWHKSGYSRWSRLGATATSCKGTQVPPCISLWRCDACHTATAATRQILRRYLHSPRVPFVYSPGASALPAVIWRTIICTRFQT